MILKKGTKLRAIQNKGTSNYAICVGDILILDEDYDTNECEDCPWVINAEGFRHNKWYLSRYKVVESEWKISYVK